MTAMRAKMYVQNIVQQTASETVTMCCVSDAPFDPNGMSEDNTFARMSPSGHLTIQITNPNLIGKFKPGQKFYLDFTEADIQPEVAA